MKKTTDKFGCLGLVANPDLPSCRAAVQAAARFIAGTGRTVLADAVTARIAGLKVTTCDTLGQLAKHCQLLVVIGGDGTMLQVVRETAPALTPILGLNAGKLGFLSVAPASEAKATLRKILAGDYSVESRPLIEARGHGKNGPFSQLALNDFVVSRGEASRMITLEVTVDDRELTRYRADGLIISSPTGSTAYSLSAGGAIVCPDADVFGITPICPHTLSNRPLLVNMKSTIRVKVVSQLPPTIFAADGQVELKLCGGDEVTIRRSRHSVRLVQLENNSFFKTLRHKLGWSGSSF